MSLPEIDSSRLFDVAGKSAIIVGATFQLAVPIATIEAIGKLAGLEETGE